MRFEDLSPVERRVILHALENQVQWLQTEILVLSEPGRCQSCHEEVRRQRSIELSVVRNLRDKLSELV